MIDSRLEKIQTMANRFHSNGSVDQITMRKINALTLDAKLDEIGADKIQPIRQKECISQGVLATILNMSSESVQKWEQGKSKPQGAALRLLSLIDRNGIKAVI